MLNIKDFMNDFSRNVYRVKKANKFGTQEYFNAHQMFLMLMNFNTDFQNMVEEFKKVSKDDIILDNDNQVAFALTWNSMLFRSVAR